MDRRDFLKKGAWVAGALGATGLIGCKRGEGTAGAPPPVAGAPPPQPTAPSIAAPSAADVASAKLGKNRVFEKPPGDVHAAVASEKEPAELVKAAIEAFGGPDAVFRKGDSVVIKPNLAWGRGPDIGANTNPEVLKAVIQMARDAGAGEVLVVEHSCDKSAISFEMSGGQEVCDEAGVGLVSLDNEAMYEEHPIAMGVNIKTDQLARDILDCDVYVNLPCLKHHEATNATLAMKNQMGANWDRQRYHREGSQQKGASNLHQNITDLATALRPTINIIDATRALTSNGPKGPGGLEETRTIIVSHDIVTADTLGAQMLGFTVNDVAHIRLAAEAGLGRCDVERLKIARV